MGLLLREVFGMYPSDADFVYVTDGGHREKLGLVELLRRRCKTIICIDASGDPPGTYKTLRTAAGLARIEVGAIIEPNDLPAPDNSSARQSHSHRVLRVGYEGCDEGGYIIYLPAELSTHTDPALQAWQLEDPVFPHYSTGNQLLNERQLQNLVELGNDVARQALDDEKVRAHIREGLADAPVRIAVHGASVTSTADQNADALSLIRTVFGDMLGHGWQDTSDDGFGHVVREPFASSPPGLPKQSR
ncbi:MAG: hypothetical protein ACXWBO_06170 [Ilumatobacteraceae bacterium]